MLRHHRCYIKNHRSWCGLCSRESDWWDLLLQGAEGLRLMLAPHLPCQGHIKCKQHQKRWWALQLAERPPLEHEQRQGAVAFLDLPAVHGSERGSATSQGGLAVPWPILNTFAWLGSAKETMGQTCEGLSKAT